MYFKLKFNNDTNKFTVVELSDEIDLDDTEYLYATREQMEIIDKGFVNNYYEFKKKYLTFKKK